MQAIQEPLTEKEAAAFLKINPRTLVSERKRNLIKPYRIAGGRIRYTVQMLQDYMRNHPLNAEAKQ